MAIIKLYNYFQKLVSPKFCLSCFNYNKNYICPTCLEKLNFRANFNCFECDRKIIEKCKIKEHSSLIKYLISFGLYENEFLKQMVLIGKDGYQEIFKDFGELMSKFLKDNDFKDYHLAFVPITNKKLIERGFNQSEVLAKTIAKNLNLRIFSGLVKTKETEDQAKLDFEKRLDNLKNVFKVNQLPPKKIILIDDIKTTGATLKECAKVLKEAGAKEIIALTILK
jgi:competence protein ComFC